MESLKLDLIKRALEDKKAEEITIIDVSSKTPFFDYYVIATINNNRHASACADFIEESFEKSSLKVRGIEGKNESEWVIVDCDDILVHLFSKNERNRISLESLLENNR